MPELSTKRTRVTLEPLSAVAADRLCGCGEIAQFYLGSDSHKNRQKIYKLVELGRIPVGREGGLLIASKGRLLRHHEEMTGGNLPE